MKMLKCKNCHQKTESLDKDGLCEDCAQAFYPDRTFVPVLVRKQGEYTTTVMKQ